MRLSSSLKITAPVLLLAGVLLGLCAWQFGWQFGWQSPWRFDLAWDEEVRLHDQRIILVHMRRSYESHSLLSRADSVRVATWISFDAGPPFGRFSHRFAPEDVALIDQHQQVWYFGAAPAATDLRAGERTPGFWTLQPGQSLRQAAPAEKLPEALTRWNVMPATPDAAGLAKFANTRLTLEQKMRHWAAHPRADGEEVIRLGPPGGTSPAQK
ncbi:MAG: hypothetical protein V4593_13010 [Pseudomonadota bacterium]